MERSNYLFQDANAKNLNFQDKQKLSYILKAYDEKTPLTINKVTKTIVFPNTSTSQTVDYPRPKSSMSTQMQNKPVEKNDPISFSYAQKLPYEKMQTPKPSPAPIVLPKKENSPSPTGRNVVNLKELG